MTTFADRCLSLVQLALPCGCLALAVYAWNLPLLDDILKDAAMQPERLAQAMSPRVTQALSNTGQREAWHLAVYRDMPQLRSGPDQAGTARPAERVMTRAAAPSGAQ